MPLHNPVWEVVEPYAVATHLYTVADPTYGRYLLPHHPPTQALLDNPKVHHTFRRVFLKPNSAFKTWEEAYETTEIVYSENVELKEKEIKEGVKRGGRWIFYSVWEMDEPDGGWEAGGKGKDHDLILVHGLSDYGLRYAPHVLHFLKAGFRVIIPDLPSYGRSTGINSYIPSIHLLPAAVHTVLKDVVGWDLAHGRTQKQVFISGASMGGWTCLDYIYKYPPSSDSAKIVSAGDDANGGPEGNKPPRPHVAGAFVLCPMVEASKESTPPKIVQLIGQTVRAIAGALPVVKGVRGNVSDDPRVEADFFADPLCYHGLLRVGTGLSLLDGMIEVQKDAEGIDAPIRLVHGNADRATSYHGTEKLFARLPNKDKQITIYDGYEHVMLKVGIDAADDEKRQRVLADWRSWLIERCK
ncbi:Caffeoylshikimate esterase [Vanrija pseudolonga]|uniref:Caffeoylshikimate esterase n=1 Tax=Vanrija pseudolonga TaxID=143232 RepID=A0AAF1BKC4_9TREE|nr:Caffeoylshikimate esterase [Vanrija pseudolonga]